MKKCNKIKNPLWFNGFTVWCFGFESRHSDHYKNPPFFGGADFLCFIELSGLFRIILN